MAEATESRREEGVAGCAFGVSVNVHHRNAGILGKLDRNGRCGRARRNVDQCVDVLGQQVLDLVDLRRSVALGVDRDDFDAMLLGFVLDGLLRSG